VVLVATPAYAHAPVPGIKGFCVGLLHPISSPARAVLMSGLALLIDGFFVPQARRILGAVLAASILGLVLGHPGLDLDTAMYIFALSTCAVAALVPGRLLSVALIVATVGAILLGVASIPEPGRLGDRIFTMGGSIIGVNLGLLLLWGGCMFVRDRLSWMPGIAIGFHVIAAWVGATALIMLALSVSDPSTIA